MKKSLKIGTEILYYTLKESARARYLRVTIYHDGVVTVTVPSRPTRGLRSGLLGQLSPRFSESTVERFLTERGPWILKKLEHYKDFKPSFLRQKIPGGLAYYKDRALELVTNRLEHFNHFYNFTYKTVRIKDQKTRWGSCSRRGNINFNYRIALLHPAQVDYIVVHELCHLGQMNHSRKFWELVARTIPEWRKLRRELREVG